jgi:hypothetical protein
MTYVLRRSPIQEEIMRRDELLFISLGIKLQVHASSLQGQECRFLGWIETPFS